MRIFAIFRQLDMLLTAMNCNLQYSYVWVTRTGKKVQYCTLSWWEPWTCMYEYVGMYCRCARWSMVFHICTCCCLILWIWVSVQKPDCHIKGVSWLFELKSRIILFKIIGAFQQLKRLPSELFQEIVVWVLIFLSRKTKNQQILLSSFRMTDDFL